MKNSTRQLRPGLLATLLFCLSFSLLAYEILLLRVLAYLQWYHFAYLIISLALLGFGASGTLLAVFRPFWERHRFRSLFGAILLTSSAMALSRWLLAYLPMDTFLAVWEPQELIWIALLCLILFLPFLVGAFAIVLGLSAMPGRVGILYGANLLGSGAGALGGLLLLTLQHPLDIPYTLALFTAALGFLFPRARTPAGGVLPIMTIALVLVAGWILPTRPQMSQYKPLARARLMPQTKPVWESTDPHGVLTVVSSPHLRNAAGLSFSFKGEINPRPTVFLDGNLSGSLPDPADTAATAPLRHVLTGLAYRIGRPRNVLVLGSGPGMEVQQAILEGAGAVTAVESHGRLIDILSNRLPAYPSIYSDPRVGTFHAYIRTFLARDSAHYDLVIVPPLESQVAAATGIQALYENYTLTVESVLAMMERLGPEGRLVLSSWLSTPPRRSLKLATLLTEALRRSGRTDPQEQLMAVRSWNMITFLLSRQPFTDEDINRLQAFSQTEGFDVLYPRQTALNPEEELFHEQADGTLVQDLTTILEPQGGTLISPFQLTPPTDSQPYFGHFFTWRSLPFLKKTLGPEGLLLTEWGYILVWITLGMLILGGTVLILLPLVIWTRRLGEGYPGHMLRPLPYFALIGAGFMFVEILWIQRLILILGEPVYAVAAVITALLVFAGLGSAVLEKLKLPPSTLIMLATGSAGLYGVLIYLGLTYLTPVLAALPLVLRFGSSLVLLSPLAFLMGLFFPCGIKALYTRSPERDPEPGTAAIAWAWGINGFISVLSTPLATVVAITAGLHWVGVAGIVCYLAAAAWLWGTQAGNSGRRVFSRS